MSRGGWIVVTISVAIVALLFGGVVGAIVGREAFPRVERAFFAFTLTAG